MRKGINISHVNIENMGGRDQSQIENEIKSFEKIKSVPKYIPKSHNDDNNDDSLWHFVPCVRTLIIWRLKFQDV